MNASSRFLPASCAAALMMAIGPGALASGPSPTKSPAASGIVGCLLVPSRTADIGTPSAGVVEHIAVDRGDVVRAGQVLVRLKADSERASLSSARARAETEAAIGAARAAADLSRAKLERAEDLHKNQFISPLALDQARAEYAVAERTLQQAVEQRAVSQTDLHQARAALSSRFLTSPINGIVVNRMAHPGERVELHPLLRIVDTSELHVEIVVPARHFGSVPMGAELKVHPDVPSVPPKAARVTQVDRVIDTASNTFRVRLLLPNTDGAVPAGARCRVDLPAPTQM